MIPKIIHYCWLSGDPFPERIQKCIDSWVRLMPDYEFVCWDMQRFDIHTAKFTQQACEKRKWAFASDYIRLYALYHHGGIYLDTDVMAFGRLDDYLNEHAFSSIESYFYKEGCSDDFRIEACIMGAEKGNQFIKECLDLYDKREFIKNDGSNDETVITKLITVIAEKNFGLKRGVFSKAPIRLMDGVLTLFPPHTFTHFRGDFRHDSVTMHLYLGGWRDKQPVKNKVIYAMDDVLVKVFGLRRWALMRWTIRKRYLWLKGCATTI